MTYATPATPSPRAGKPWLLIVGAVLLVLSLVLCGIGAVTGVSPALDLADKPEQSAPQTVQLEAGESTSVWSQTEGATCTATGPGGPVGDTAQSEQNVTIGDKELTRVMAIEADQDGEYTISCSAPFVVGEGLGAGGIITATIGGGLCCLSVVLVVVGLVLWLRRRRS